MELLKRKRAGEDINELTESGSEEEEVRAAFDTDSDFQALSEFEDEEESPEHFKKKISAAKTSRRRASGDEDQDHYDSEFVVDDDEAPLGVPGFGKSLIIERGAIVYGPIYFKAVSGKIWNHHSKMNASIRSSSRP